MQVHTDLDWTKVQQITRNVSLYMRSFKHSLYQVSKFRSTTLTSMSSLHGAEWPLLFLLTVTDEWKAMMWLSAPVLVKPSNMCGLNNYWFSIFCTAFIYPMDYSSMAAVPLSVLQDFYRNCSGCCIYNSEQHLVYIFGKNSGLEVL